MKYKIGDIVKNSKMTAQIIGYGDTKKYRGHDNLGFYILKCLKCGYEFERDEETTEKGRNHRDIGCPCCSNRVIIPGINDIPTTDPWMVDYFQNGYDEAKLYSSGSGKTIFPRCPLCGRVKKTQMSIHDLKRYHGFKCICHDGKSVPNKFIYGLSEELERTGQITKFKNEFKLDGKFFDMCYIEDEILIEMDSGVNHGHINLKHKNKPIPSSEFRNDLVKDKIANDNSYKIIRIDCFKSEFDYIKNSIMNSEINQLFDLSIIEWNNVLKLCSNNLIEEVSKYKKLNPKLSASKIAPVFGISDVTVRKYLKIGDQLGLCKYDVKDEWNNYLENRTYYQSKPILVDPLNDEYEIKIYESIADFERNSLKDFDMKVSADTLRNNGLIENGFCYAIDDVDVYLLDYLRGGIDK